MTQNAKLICYLEKQGSITTAESTDKLRIFRLSERIRELQDLGYVFDHLPERTPNGARVIRYKLITGESCGDYGATKRGDCQSPQPHRPMGEQIAHCGSGKRGIPPPPSQLVAHPNSAPQPSTAKLPIAPSKEGVGQGGVAVAEPHEQLISRDVFDKNGKFKYTLRYTAVGFAK